ncbi:asparagine-rich protein-like isoform X2 [Vespa velutina]|uniref:asparagine-rich protein-like isoform X2 n=1 Tax=Vespa velutina TaxID=202808 RepID=UPI001FB2EBE4|nr:asparagine-rich protein-like isoform X2 [Vespa velutina]
MWIDINQISIYMYRTLMLQIEILYSYRLECIFVSLFIVQVWLQEYGTFVTKFVDNHKSKVKVKKALQEYKKIWTTYLDFVRQYQEGDSKSLSEEKTQIGKKIDENNKSSGSMYSEEPNSTYSIENTQQQSTLDVHSSMESLFDKNIFENISSMPESPIFFRNKSNFKNINSNRNICMDSSSESISTINNLRNDNKQEMSDKTNSAVTEDSTSNVPSLFLCSTPTRNKKCNISKTKNVKRNTQSKTATPLNNLKIRNNLRTIRKEKALNKTPLQVINNMSLTPKNNSRIDKSNIKLNTIPYNIQVTSTPNSKKLKQTKLVFHKTKKTMELSNNLKSTGTPVLTKTDKSVFNQETISKQSILTNIISTKKKGIDDEHIDNICNQTEKTESIIESAQIKNELIYQQEYEINNQMEINDPLNISNESLSTFFLEYENNINLDQNVNNCSIDKTFLPSAKSETKSQHIKKKQTKILKTKENVINIIDLDEAAEKRIKLSKNRSCRECEQYGEKQCYHFRNIPYKRETTPMDFCISMSPDSPSSTT